MNEHLFAIVCRHCAKEHAPFLRAKRDTPVEPGDSGWQFLCGRDHADDDGTVMSVENVIKLDSTLSSVVKLPVGTDYWRPSGDALWQAVERNN